MQRRPSSGPPPSSRVAEVRARHPLMLLTLVGNMVPASHAAILAQLRADTRDKLERAIPMTWIPMEVDVEVIEAVAERLGPATTAMLVETRQREEMGSALFSGFVQTGLRVLGASPATMIKRLPTGWTHLFRNAGVVEIVSTQDREAVARFRGLPDVCIRSAAWMAALPVGLAMLFELVGVLGTVECHIEDAAAGDARVVFRWT